MYYCSQDLYQGMFYLPLCINQQIATIMPCKKISHNSVTFSNNHLFFFTCLDLAWGQLIWTQPGWSWLQVVDLLLLPYLAVILLGSAASYSEHVSVAMVEMQEGKFNYTCMFPALVCICLLIAHRPKQFTWSCPLSMGQDRYSIRIGAGGNWKITCGRLRLGEEWIMKTARLFIMPGWQSTWRRRLSRGQQRNQVIIFPSSSCGYSLPFPLQGGVKAAEDGLTSPFGMTFSYLCTLLWRPLCCLRSTEWAAHCCWILKTGFSEVFKRFQEFRHTHWMDKYRVI